MKQIYNLLFLALIFFTSKTNAQVAAIYTSATEGTLAGVPFTVSNISGENIISYNYTSANYSAAPLSNSQESIDYSYNSNWTITFDSPIENLLLYTKFWRTMEVVFDQPFTILSGSLLKNPGGDTLTTTAFSDGIIQFSQPVTTLSLNVISIAGGSQQAMTFGKNTTVSIDDAYAKSEDIEIYPNPSNNFIQVSNLKENVNYNIYNALGAQVKSGTIFNQERIDIESFTNGLYFLKLDNGKTIKFIKE